MNTATVRTRVGKEHPVSDMQPTPLSSATLYAILAAEDIERAKGFWRDTVGLKIKEYPAPPGYFSAYAGDCTEVLVYERERSKAEHTVAGFRVHDLRAVVRQLKERGVVFERYDIPGMPMVDDIAEQPIVWSAWFKDTEGNIIGITQEKPAGDL
jgi:predicted enzyme related to lactoylglutathione lyase